MSAGGSQETSVEEDSTMRDFENIESQNKLVLNNANNKTIPLVVSDGDYPESVVLEQAAQPWFTRRFKNH